MPTPFTPQTKALLLRIPYFEDFSDDALRYVAEEIQVRQCNRGEVLFLQGDEGTGLHLVVAGLCKIYSVSVDGREQILYKLGDGDYCNEVSAVDGGVNPASFAAIEKSAVWILTKPALNRLRQRFPQLNDIIVNSLAQHARQLSARVFRLTFLSVKGRLALFLLQHSDAQNKVDRRHWPQDEIASYVGSVRDVVGRALKELKDANLITLDRRYIQIVDTDALKKLAT